MASLRAAWQRLISSSPRIAWVVTAAAVVALLVSNLYWGSVVTQSGREISAQATVVALLVQGHTVTLQADRLAPDAIGFFRFDPSGSVAILEVSDLPQPPQGMVYQLWLIREGLRDSGGLFTVDEQGHGVCIVKATRPLAEYQAIGITVEPEGGSPGPTSPRVISGRLEPSSS